MSNRRLNPTEITELRAQRAAGITETVLATSWGISRASVSRHTEGLTRIVTRNPGGGGPSMTPETAVRIRDLAAEGKSTTAISLATGVQPRAVKAVLERAPRPRELVVADQLAGWAPLCMEPGEWTDWQAMNPFTPGLGDYAGRPCKDCPVAFAAEMRSLGKCNGTPGWRPPADDHEEADVGDSITISSVSISAPCDGCVHRDVCSIRASMRGLDEADVTIPKPDPALTVGLTLTVECSHFMRAKGKGGATGRKLNLTDADRQARGDRLRAVNEANAAAKAAPAAEAAAS